MKTNCCDLLSHCWCIFNKSSALFSLLPPHILQQMQTGTKLIIIHMHDIFRKRLHYGINFYATVAPQPFKTSCVASQMKKKKNMLAWSQHSHYKDIKGNDLSTAFIWSGGPWLDCVSCTNKKNKHFTRRWSNGIRGLSVGTLQTNVSLVSLCVVESLYRRVSDLLLVFRRWWAFCGTHFASQTLASDFFFPTSPKASY